MKSLILSLGMMPSLILSVQAHGCGFMPDHFFEGIMEHPDYSDQAKQIANDTLQYTRQMRQQRQAWSGMEGFNTEDDDQDFPEEENQSDVQILQEELANYNELDSGDANPDSVETRRRRSSKARRQNNSLMRFIHNDNMNCDRTKVGPLVRKESTPYAIDFSVNDVFNGFFWVDDLYRNTFGRNSIDNRGENYRARVHHCSKLNNAFWDGIGMFFGDGDGETTYTGSFAASQDVVSIS